MVRNSASLSVSRTQPPAVHPGQSALMHGLSGQTAKQPIAQQDPMRLSVTKIWCFAPGGSQAVAAGSGVFIAPDVILTAGHVIFKPDDYGTARDGGYVGHVQLDSPWLSIPVRAASTERVVAPPGWARAKPLPDVDIGLIRLNAPVPGVATLAAYPAANTELAGAAVAAYGFPAISQQLYFGSGACAASAPSLLYYTADVGEGESGGAVMAVISAVPELVAIHRAGPGAAPADIPPSASGVRLTAAIVGWIQAMSPIL